MIAPDDDGRRNLSRSDEFVESQASPVAFAVPQPADAGGKSLESNPLLGETNPPMQRLVLWKEFEDGAIRRGDIGRVAGERHPAERSLAFGEQRTDVRRDEPRVRKSIVEPTEAGLTPQVVSVVEDLRASLLETDHRLAMLRHRQPRFFDVLPRVLVAELFRIVEVATFGDVSVKRVVRRRLIGDDVDLDPATQQLRKHLGRIAHDTDRQCAALPFGGDDAVDGIVEIIGELVKISLLDAPDDAGRIDIDAEGDTVVHRDGQRLCSPHPAETGGESECPGEGPAEALLGDGGERLEGALEDSLGADVDPRAGGHLAVHRETGGFQFPEMLPVRPVRHEQTVGDEHSRRHLVRAKHSDRFPRLHEQRLIVLEVAQRADDCVEGFPGPRRPTSAAIHDEVVGALGHLWIEVVHEAAQRSLLQPTLRVE